MLHAPQALIFDLDGVIIDSEPLHEQAKRIVFDRYGLQVPGSVYDAFKGKTDQDVIEHVIAQYGGGRLDPVELITFKQRTYQELHEDLQLVPDALPFIRRAREQFVLALTTSAVPANQQLAFRKFGLDAYFRVVVTADDITRAKPDPEPYQITARRLGLPPAACLVIEDSVNGVRSARAAGCKVAGLTTSFGADLLRAAGADFTVDTFRELACRLEIPLPDEAQGSGRTASA